MLQEWLDRESKDVNCYRGGYDSEGGFVVEDGTALHWAAYYGNYRAAKLLIEKGAGVILLVLYSQLKLVLLMHGFKVFTAVFANF